MYSDRKLVELYTMNCYWYFVVNSRHELIFNTPNYNCWPQKNEGLEAGAFRCHASVKVSEKDIDIRTHQYNPENTFYIMVFESEEKHKREDIIFIKEKLWCSRSELFPDVLANHFHLVRGSDIGKAISPSHSHIWTGGTELTGLIEKLNGGNAFVNLLYISDSRQNIHQLEDVLRQLFVGVENDPSRSVVMNLFVTNFETNTDCDLTEEEYYTRMTDYMRPYGVSANTKRGLNFKESRGTSLINLLEGFYSTRPSTLTHPILLSIPDNLVKFSVNNPDAVCGRFYRNGRDLRDRYKYFFVNESVLVPHFYNKSTQHYYNFCSVHQFGNVNKQKDALVAKNKMYNKNRLLMRMDTIEQLKKKFDNISLCLDVKGNNYLAYIHTMVNNHCYYLIQSLVENARDCGAAMLNRNEVFNILQSIIVDIFTRGDLYKNYQNQKVPYSYLSLSTENELDINIFLLLRGILYNFPECSSKKKLSLVGINDGVRHHIIVKELINILSSLQKELQGRKNSINSVSGKMTPSEMTEKKGLEEEVEISKLISPDNKNYYSRLLYSTDMHYILFTVGLNGVDVGKTGTNPNLNLEDGLCRPLEFWTFSKNSIIPTLFDANMNLKFTSSLINMKGINNANLRNKRQQMGGVIIPIVNQVSPRSLFMETNLFRDMLTSALTQTPSVCKNNAMYHRLVDLLLIGMVRLKSVITHIIEENGTVPKQNLHALKYFINDLNQNMDFFVKEICSKQITAIRSGILEKFVTEKDKRLMFYALSTYNLNKTIGQDESVKLKKDYMTICLREAFMVDVLKQMRLDQFFRTENMEVNSFTPLSGNLTWTEMFSQLGIVNDVLDCMESAEREYNGCTEQKRPKCDTKTLANIIRANEKFNKKVNDDSNGFQLMLKTEGVSDMKQQQFDVLVGQLSDLLQANGNNIHNYNSLSSLITTYENVINDRASSNSPHPLMSYLGADYSGHSFRSYNKDYERKKKSKKTAKAIPNPPSTNGLPEPAVPKIFSDPPSADELPEPSLLVDNDDNKLY